MKCALALAVVISALAGATTTFTSFHVWKKDGSNASDSKQLVVVDGDIIVAGGV